MEATNTNTDPSTISEPYIDQTDITTPPHFLSLLDAAFFGLQSPCTLRITGYINGRPVTTLIDCGSTHNIIQLRIASLLNNEPTSITPFTVMVGNGQHLECNGFLPNVPLKLKKKPFMVPLFVLPVAGADIILGVAWLSSLAPLVADFLIPQISFMFNGKTCTLEGEPLSTPVSPSSLHTLIKKNSIASLHTMIFHHQLENPTPTTRQPHTNPPIEQLLNKFKPLFEPPHDLPPPRDHDLHIPLLPHAKRVNIKPYRYPQYKKKS